MKNKHSIIILKQLSLPGLAGLNQFKPRIHRNTQRQKESDEATDEELYEPFDTEPSQSSQVGSSKSAPTQEDNFELKTFYEENQIVLSPVVAILTTKGRGALVQSQNVKFKPKLNQIRPTQYGLAQEIK